MGNGARFSAVEVGAAAKALQTALHGPFAGYMEYRLGEAKSRDLNTALDALIKLAQSPDVSEIALTPSASSAAADQAL